MKFVCLGYYDEKQWETMSEGEQGAFMDQCFAYDEALRKNGHTVGDGGALQAARNATTLRFQKGKVVITDGPYAETKEQLGGFFTLEAKDMSQAIELMSKHPGVKAGPFEIRPVEDMSEAIRASEQRRSVKKQG
ncbi:MAG: dehydrogenase [Acidobacteria bacterium RIFCSPLOWO2_02_FULL_61_28]|nr:MAG: dehydrogenase [Acidobacteria bacterium RIFCSPLOWO2_02_FULL_61_28]